MISYIHGQPEYYDDAGIAKSIANANVALKNSPTTVALISRVLEEWKILIIFYRKKRLASLDLVNCLTNKVNLRKNTIWVYSGDRNDLFYLTESLNSYTRKFEDIFNLAPTSRSIATHFSLTFNQWTRYNRTPFAASIFSYSKNTDRFYLVNPGGLLDETRLVVSGNYESEILEILQPYNQELPNFENLDQWKAYCKELIDKIIKVTSFSIEDLVILDHFPLRSI